MLFSCKNNYYLFVGYINGQNMYFYALVAQKY